MRINPRLMAVVVAVAAVVTGCTAGDGPGDVTVATTPATSAGLGSFEGSCSGAVVAGKEAMPSDQALFMTNGHCDLDNAVLGRANANTPTQASVVISTGPDTPSLAVQADRRLYWTMTGTDVALFQLQRTYADLATEGVRPFQLSDRTPAPGEEITVATPDTKYRCTVARTVPTVMEMGLATNDVLAYSPECNTGPGTSGAPVLDDKGTVVAINNSHNSSGGKCTQNEPCEVDRQGAITVSKGTGYAPPVRVVAACLTGSRLVLGREGCTLPKP